MAIDFNELTVLVSVMKKVISLLILITKHIIQWNLVTKSLEITTNRVILLIPFLINISLFFEP